MHLDRGWCHHLCFSQRESTLLIILLKLVAIHIDCFNIDADNFSAEFSGTKVNCMASYFLRQRELKF